MAVPYKLNYFEIETGIDSTSTFIHTGDFTATKVKKYLGTSNDILLGDGTTASLSGKQNTITLTTTGSSGAATLIGATLNIPNYGGALSGYVPYTGANQTLAMGTNNGITLTDTGSSSSIIVTSSSTGSGAIVVNKSVDGQGLTVNNAGIGSGFYANNSSTGNGVLIGNASTGKGLVIDNAALAIGDPFVYTLGGAAFVKAKIDYLGNITGNSFVKTGGTSSQFLKADGSVDSTAYGTGSVTSVAALTLGTTGTDLSSTVANGNTTPVITLNVPTASATNRGALSSSDWTTFNSKQNTITLTTSGSSGASTFISNTLNVPNYTLSGLGGVPTSRTLTINGTTQDLSADRTFSVGTVTSVGLSMPAAFSVASSPINSSGTIAVTGAGLASQYIRGDGQLADFPTGGGGGGSSVSYYLNGSVNQGTFVGNTYYEMNKTPIFGAGTDFNIAADGYVAQFITDANDPNSLLIPAGNWNFETFFSASSGGGTPTFYIELYKYDGTAFTLISSNATNPELIAFGTTIAPYFSSLAVPETVLLATDRLAIRIYVVVSGRTITLHTENSHLCQVITTFTTGLQSLNGLTKQTQYLAVGTSGTDFAISSSVDTHTFNLPTASATNRGALSSANWTTFNSKQDAITLTTTGSSGASTFISNTLNVPNYTLSGLGGVPTSRQLTINGTAYDLSADRSWSVGTVTSVAALTLGTSGSDLSSTVANGSTTPVITLNVPDASATARGVITTGTQTIGGFKTFNSTLTISNGTSHALSLEIGTSGNTASLKAPATGSSVIATLPAASGTIALTSDLSGYLPLTGGTLTGALSGTSGTFSGTGTFGTLNSATIPLVANANTSNIGLKLIGTSVGNGNGTYYYANNGSTLLGSMNISGTAMAITNEQTGILYFATSGSERMRITSAGNVGIGTSTDGGFRLDVLGAIPLRIVSNSNATTPTYGAYQIFRESNTVGDGVGIGLGMRNSSNANVETSYIGTIITTNTTGAERGDLAFYTNNGTATRNERMRITSSGNVGIGTASPTNFSGYTTLTVNGTSGGIVNCQYNGTDGLRIASQVSDTQIYEARNVPMVFSTNAAERMRITSAGYVWLNGAISGFSGSSVGLQVNGGGMRSVGQLILHNGTDVSLTVPIACTAASTLTITGALSVTGSLSKGSGSFRIEHPLPSLSETHQLVHSFVEAPQADLYYRGKIKLVDGKGQANIDEIATMTEGTFEVLCRDIQCFTTNESGWDLVRGKVVGNIIYLESQNEKSTDEISWLVIGERKDKHIMETDWTDENGKVIVEPLKPIEQEPMEDLTEVVEPIVVDESTQVEPESEPKEEPTESKPKEEEPDTQTQPNN